MLYRSTRNNVDSFTSYRALRQRQDKLSGYLVPFHTPSFLAENIEMQSNQPISQNVADFLNLLFDSKFSLWDIECALGRTPIALTDAGQKIVLARCWNNPTGNVNYIIDALYKILCQGQISGDKVTAWAKTGIYMALIGAAALELYAHEKKPIDIAVNATDFYQVYGAYYCRMIGLPIGNIIISCNENSAIWDFVYRGTLRCGGVKLKSADLDMGLPEMLEPLVFSAYGIAAANKLAECASAGIEYCLDGEQLPLVNQAVYAYVIGQDRIPAVISSVERNNGYAVSPCTASSLGALQDFRAKIGESNLTLVLDEQAPM